MTTAANTSATDEVLRVENIGVRFDDVIALEGISFRISAGETRVVLGAAGSGKTTLLKACLGLIKVNSGRVFLFGRDITELKNASFSISAARWACCSRKAASSIRLP